MGQGPSNGQPPGGMGFPNKKEQKKKKKFEPRPPTRVGKKKRKRGAQASARLPQSKRAIWVVLESVCC